MTLPQPAPAAAATAEKPQSRGERVLVLLF
jgi:hypothetical protein